MSTENEALAKLAELQAALQAQDRQIGLLTKRVWQLEQRPHSEAAPLPSLPPTILEQALAEEPPPLTALGPAPSLLSSPGKILENDWESKFGSNWLNRAGILLLVIGVSLFLAYSLAFMGPAAKIAIGTLIGAALLVAGYTFRVKDQYRLFALGLIAGGFAILYFTAFAAYAVDAARVISSRHAGVALQAGIALVAVWQATRLANEKAAILAFFGAFAAFQNVSDSALLHGGVLPLTAAALWLAGRLGWHALPYWVLAFSWASVFQSGIASEAGGPFGKGVVWIYWVLFEVFEIYQRRRLESWRNPIWVAANATLFLSATFATPDTIPARDVARIALLFAAAQAVASALRLLLKIRGEAASEAFTVILLCVAAASHWAREDHLLILMVFLALAMITLAWNRRESRLALILAGEGLLALTAAVLIVVLPESKRTMESPLRIHLALPQTLILMASLFAVGRWLSVTPWPSWAALVCTAVITLITIPQTLGTIVLALEAILALAAGLYLSRRPIRLGGLALFCFSVLKVFFYDLSELDTLPRIFSFIVLGLLSISASWAYTRFREQVKQLL